MDVHLTFLFYVITFSLFLRVSFLHQPHQPRVLLSPLVALTLRFNARHASVLILLYRVLVGIPFLDCCNRDTVAMHFSRTGFPFTTASFPLGFPLVLRAMPVSSSCLASSTRSHAAPIHVSISRCNPSDWRAEGAAPTSHHLFHTYSAPPCAGAQSHARRALPPPCLPTHLHGEAFSCDAVF